ncbi:MAG: histidine--tRNA ligase [Treponema sp.]|nr:histidine--tRNA ligase [Treponema sp.]
MSDFIEPKILKGFRDFLPAAEIARQNLVEKIENCFRSYGFLPIDTPALEYAEILLGKGGGETEKQIYRFTDNGERDVALRFDLTVPLARFLAAHRAELNFPFKRYHIAKVWRGENTQRGRYREFTQCDFDILGSTSAASDFEILHIMYNTLRAAAGGEVKIHINHRGLFNRFLGRLELLDKSVAILRTVDKLAKIGGEETLQQLTEIIGEEKAVKVLEFIGLSGGFEKTLAAMTAAAGPGPESEHLALIYRYMLDSGIAGSIVLDPSITRGLDYYTGIVFESFLAELPEIGSICSGGRYDNLVGLYSKESIPGVGTSIGLDRLLAALESLGRLQPRQSYALTAIACLAEKHGGAYQALAERLRKEGIACEVFLEEEKLVKQFQAAEKKGIRWLLIPDAEKPLDGPITLRDISKRENREGLTIEELVGILTTPPSPA